MKITHGRVRKLTSRPGFAHSAVEVEAAIARADDDQRQVAEVEPLK